MSASTADWVSGVVCAPGVDLHYTRTGGAKPPLILLHGLMASGACWTPIARMLQDQFDVIMPDARGHGRSDAPLDGYRYDDHAADVGALIADLELAAPAVLGHSMGGMTAAVFAREIGDGISGVVLVDPTFISPQWQREVRDGEVAEQHRRTLSLDKAAVLADLRSRHPHRSSEALELIAEARLQTRMSAFDVLTPPNPDYRRLVCEIAAPMLLVISDSGVVSRETAMELQALNPRLQVEQIANAGHGIPFDQPERLHAVVSAFLCET